MKEASYHLTLLAQNRTGFRNLVKLASAAFLEGFYFKPRIDKELLAAHQRRAHLPERLRLERVEPHAAGRRRGRTWRRPSKSPPGSASSSATTTTSRSRTTAWRSQRRGDGGGRRGRQAAGHPAGGHQRRPLRPPRGRRGPGHPALRQHGQVPHRHEPDADGDATSSTSAARRRCTRRSPAWKTPCGAARRSPTASTSSWSWASGTSPSSRRRTDKTAEEYLRELCLDGLEGALRRTSPTAAPTASCPTR